MSRILVIDASVVLKWFSGDKELDRDLAIKVYEEMSRGEIRLIAPEFLLVEVSNVLARKKKLPKDDLKRVVDMLMESGIEFLGVPIDLVVDATYKHEISVYDALYVALAETQGVGLLTEDARLLELDLGVGLRSCS